MIGCPLRDGLALLAGLVAPFLVALALVPFRTDLSHTNAALILVVAVVAIAALGSRIAGALGALPAVAWYARGGAAKSDTASSPGRTRPSTSTRPRTSRRRCCCWSSA